MSGIYMDMKGNLFKVYRTRRFRMIPTSLGVDPAFPGDYVLWDINDDVFWVEKPCIFEERYQYIGEKHD